MLDFLNQTLTESPAIPLDVLLKKLGVAFGMGCLATGIYAITCRRPKRGLDRAFLATLVLLSLLIALVTVVIGSSVARAFSLVGTLAIVRFRTVVEDTRDTAFVIYSVAAGMCAGSGKELEYIIGPFACAPLVLLTAWVFRPRREEAAVAEGKLVLRLAAGRSPDERIQALLQQHLRSHRLSGLSTARGGSAFDATYTIQLPAPEQIYVLVSELGRVEGVQSVELKGD